MNQYGPNNEQLPEELQAALLEILREKEQEDSYVRKAQIRLWKKYERFWHGIQFIYWSEVQQDWIAPIDVRSDAEVGGNREDSEGPFYDYVINIYKANGESIIAALSNNIPGVRFPPDDADNEDDVQTARVYDKISDLIDRHNSSKLVLLQVLLNFWNQGLCAGYCAPKTDKAFGVIEIPKYENQVFCPNCGPQESLDYDTCPNCGAQTEIEAIFSGTEQTPKTRVLMEMYGPLFVKLPTWAKKQEECGYLILSVDQPSSLLKSIFPHVRDKIDASKNQYDIYEKVGRSPSNTIFTVYDNPNLNTLKRTWLRPWEIESLGDDYGEIEDPNSIKSQLKQLFPDGIYLCTIGNDIYVESRNEDLDKYWTIGKATLSQYIHSDPQGQSLIPVQELRNIQTNVTAETIEQGIPITYADPSTIDFETYSKHEVRPGTLAPARPKAGQPLANSFFEGPRATLSPDVPAFVEKLDQDGQMVSGAFPSIYGGPTEESSRTAAEYNMSRQMALQRLSITWCLLTHFWAKLKERAVHLYVENVVADHKYTVREGDNYVTVWIKQSELNGKVGDVEAEGADTFPITLAEKQNLLFKLLTLNNEFINEALFDVENRKIISNALSFPELKIPEEGQRVKQAREISWIQAHTQQVPIEPGVDDDAVHSKVCQDFMISDAGLVLKMTQPEIYALIGQHKQMHDANIKPQKAQVKEPKLSITASLDRLAPNQAQAISDEYGVEIPQIPPPTSPSVSEINRVYKKEFDNVQGFHANTDVNNDKSMGSNGSGRVL